MKKWIKQHSDMLITLGVIAIWVLFIVIAAPTFYPQ